MSSEEAPVIARPAVERLNEPQSYSNVTEINPGGLPFRIMVGEIPVPKFEIIPGTRFSKNPESRIFQELKRICSSAADIQVELHGGNRPGARGVFVAVIRPAGYKGEPRLVKKPYLFANPDGSPGEDICDHVIRDFEIRFHSRYGPGEISRMGAKEAAYKKVGEVIPKYLHAINKEYICFYSSILSLSPNVWQNLNGTIKSTTYTTFSIIYPASMEESCVPEQKAIN